MERVITKAPNGELTIKEVDKISLKLLQDEVEGLIDFVRVTPDIDIVTNDESIILEKDLNIVIQYDEETETPLYGNIVFVSHTPEGDSVGLTDEQINLIKACIS